MRYPLTDININQYFGEKDPAYTNLGMLGHNGIDFRASMDTPVYACHDGIANYQTDADGGNGVVIINPEGKFKSIYWHFPNSGEQPKFKSPIEGNIDFPVKEGDLIGYSGSSGLSTGPHLHFGIKLVAQGESNGAWYNTDQQNGYFGAVDPLPFLPILYYTFAPVEYGQTSVYVANLQHRLLQLGYFYTPNYDQYGIYGRLTAKAVLAFQKDHCDLSLYEKYILLGRKVGPKTLEALNK